MTYGTQVASQPAGRGRLAVVTVAALGLSAATIGLAIAGLLHFEAQYGRMTHLPRLAELSFRVLHSGPWLAGALLVAGGLFALAYLLARRQGAWLVLLAPLVYLAVLVPLVVSVWLPLHDMLKVVK